MQLTAGGVTYETSAETSAAATTSITLTNFDPGSGSNRVLVVALNFDGIPTGVTVTYGGTPLTLVPNTSGVSADGTASEQLWYLTNPSSTAANIVASWTGSVNASIGAAAFNGANQTAPVTNGTSATANSTAIAVAVNSRPAT